MPPRKPVNRHNSRRPNQRRAIAINQSRGPPKNPHKRPWTPAHDLQLVQAFAIAFKNSKVKVWPRIRRDSRFNILLGPYPKNDLLKRYNDLSQRDVDHNQLFFNHLLVPLATPQRRVHIPLEHVPLSISTAPLPPLYGPRVGLCDSDDDFDPTASNEQNYTTTSVLNNHPTTDVTDTIKERIENTTLECLKFKLASNEYQSSIMLARNQYNKDHPDQQVDQATLPPVNGLKYLDLPTFPSELLKYSTKLPHTLKLLAPQSFFPTMQDEYRFMYQQVHFYYSHRSLPVSLQHHPDLYQTIQQRLRIKTKRVSEDGDNYQYNDIMELYYDQGVNQDEWNKRVEPKYLTPLASLKTYLNNVIGLPMWYSIVVANYIYLFQEAQYLDGETNIQPPDLALLHAHQRKIVNIILVEHFSHFNSIFSQNVIRHNAKERFQSLMVGGGRHVDGNDIATTQVTQALGSEDADMGSTMTY